MSDEAKFRQVINELNEIRKQSGVNVNGRLYSMVKDRVEIFRREFGSAYGIETNVDYRQGFERNAVIIAMAKITNVNGVTLASGHAMDRVGSDEISWTACVEATETAAIGRALACFGLHGGEFASDAEMGSIPRKQEAVQETKQETRQEVRRERLPASSGFYVPDDHDAAWSNLSEMARRVIEEMGKIDTTADLSKYWSDLSYFVKCIEAESRPLLSEIKAAFATRHNEVNSR